MYSRTAADVQCTVYSLSACSPSVRPLSVCDSSCHSALSVVAARGEWIINQTCLSARAGRTEHGQGSTSSHLPPLPPVLSSDWISHHQLPVRKIRSLRNTTLLQRQMLSISTCPELSLTDGDSPLINWPNISNLTFVIFTARFLVSGHHLQFSNPWL